MNKSESNMGTPFSSSAKLHDKKENKKENPLLLAKGLFENAEDYFLASQIIIAHNSNLVPVSFMNLAFSCELYLKSILFQFKEDNTKINIHKLYDLYELLPSKQKEEIKNGFLFTWDKKGDFKTFFQEVSETFVFARYLHERNSACFSFELFKLAVVIRNCAKKIYNAQILENNKTALEKLEEYKSTNTEPTLKFWIYYSENNNCNIEIAAKMLIENLCDSLKSDYNNYECDKESDDRVREPALILNFKRESYIFSEEYNSIARISSSVFEKHGLSFTGLRTNGHQVFLQKEIE